MTDDWDDSLGCAAVPAELLVPTDSVIKLYGVTAVLPKGCISKLILNLRSVRTRDAYNISKIILGDDGLFVNPLLRGPTLNKAGLNNLWVPRQDHLHFLQSLASEFRIDNTELLCGVPKEIYVCDVSLHVKRCRGLGISMVISKFHSRNEGRWVLLTHTKNSELSMYQSASPMPPGHSLCRVCAKRTTMRCSRCKHVFYCSDVCIKKDWKTHKKVCVVDQI